MDIGALLPISLLDVCRQEGYIKEQHHPTLPLTILNYTEKAQYERVWNEVTTQCRGLIYNHITGEVVARPFPKFFNAGEDVNLAAQGDVFHGPVRVTDKQDGSLGILYDDGDGGAIATRGSFTSDQAIHASAIWIDSYEEVMRPLLGQYPTGYTWLFEIIYPQNRIVLDYGDVDDLVLLDCIDTETGASRFEWAAQAWPGPVTEVHDYASLADVVASPHRDNKEGFVVHFLDTEARVKVKHEDYVRLHRIVTGLTKRRLWEKLAVWSVIHEINYRDPMDATDAQTVARLLAMNPADVEGIITAGPAWIDDLLKVSIEEAHNWITDTVDELRASIVDLQCEVQEWYEQVETMPTRKEQALYLQERLCPYKDLVFHLLNGQGITPTLWKRIYPEHEPFWHRSEAIA